MLITLSNNKTININPILTFGVFMYYEGKRDEILESPSHEERFKSISFSMIEQQEEQISYSEYSDISQDDLISIAEELLKEGQEIYSEFQKTNPNDDFLKRVNESIDTIFYNNKMKIAEKLAPTLSPVITRIYEFTNGIDFTAIRGAFDKITEQLSSISKIVNEIIPPHFIESLKEYNETAVDEVLELKIAMLENGWVNALNLEDEEILNILVKYMEGSSPNIIDTVDRSMVELYTEDKISEITVRWERKQWLKKRYHILNSVIDAHLKREYVLSIPALLAQLEGIIRDVIPHNHGRKNMTNKDIRDYLEELHENDERIDIGKIINEYLKENIHQGFTTGKPLKSDLSRNAILHGEDTQYGNEINSLKLIFLFDYVQEILSKNYDLG